MATPFYNHVKKYPNVYEPAEDTFLLIDALEKDQNYLLNLKPRLCLEVGGGSGIVLSFVKSILGNSAQYLSTDRNPEAVECIKETFLVNGGEVDVIKTDLVSGIDKKKQVDVLIFNPPYVVTYNEEIDKDFVASTYAGGDCGRVVMNRFFPNVSSLLSENGVFYLVVIKENKPEQIIKLFKEEYKMDGEIIMERKAGPELLKIIKFTRNS